MRIEDLDTPAIVIDLARAEANLARAQDHLDKLGLAMRPHVKTHKLPYFAKRQIELGAVGLTCQKLGEAEAMADAGVEDIFLPYNILGQSKLDRLNKLHQRLTLAVTADSMVTLHGYRERFPFPDRPLTVLIECDTGAGRCGVQSVDEVAELARAISKASGLRFGGLMTYPPQNQRAKVQAWLKAAVERLKAEVIDVPVISIGGTPDLYHAHDIPIATEYRPGTYIYSDRMQVGQGHGTLDDCALTVQATVVSRPTVGRAVLDAGSKALAADLCNLPGHGHIVEFPYAVIESLSEEHAVVDLTNCPERPKIGDRVSVIPNHACVVTNLFNEVHLARGAEIVETLPVAARGRMG